MEISQRAKKGVIRCARRCSLALVAAMSWPILAAWRENCDLAVGLVCEKVGLNADEEERRRRDSTGNLDARCDIDCTAAWNSAVLSTPISFTCCQLQ